MNKIYRPVYNSCLLLAWLAGGRLAPGLVAGAWRRCLVIQPGRAAVRAARPWLVCVGATRAAKQPATALPASDRSCINKPGKRQSQ